MSTYDRLFKVLVSTWFDRLLRNSRQVPGGFVAISTDFVQELVIPGLRRINKLVTPYPTDLIVRFHKPNHASMPGHVPGIFFGGIACGVTFFTDGPDRAGYIAAIEAAI